MIRGFSIFNNSPYTFNKQNYKPATKTLALNNKLSKEIRKIGGFWKPLFNLINSFICYFQASKDIKFNPMFLDHCALHVVKRTDKKKY